jgi:hypothetical protein
MSFRGRNMIRGKRTRGIKGNTREREKMKGKLT